MPIINRPLSESTEENSEDKSGIISRKKVQAADVDQLNMQDSQYQPMKEPTQRGPGNRFSRMVAISAVLILMVMIVVVFPKYTGVSDSFDKESVVLEVERLIRISSVISLLEKKIEQNRNALAQAEKIKDTVLIETMRLSLSQNLIDIEEHQNNYIDTILSLDRAYRSDKDGVVDAIKDQIKSGEDSYKMGRVDAINKAIRLIESAQNEKPAKDFFINAVKTQK